MPYVEAHASLRNHPKTKKLARALGISKVQAIGHLLCLWWWCQDYAQDGNLSKFGPDDIAEAADWEGDSSAFTQALIDSGGKGEPGFLADDGVGLAVHDWYEYGGKLFIQREQGAARQAAKRARDKAVTGSHDVTPVTNVDKTVNNALVTRDDSVTSRDVTLIEEIREDKSRGEEIRKEETEVIPAPQAKTTSRPAPIRVYIESGGAFPTGKLASGGTKKAHAIEHILENVQDDPQSLAFWSQVVAGYCMQWSNKSYTVMVEYYLKGKLPPGCKPSTGSNGSGPKDAPIYYMDVGEERIYFQSVPGGNSVELRREKIGVP